MDKWASPLPGLAMLDGLVLLIVAVAVVMFLRRKREHEALSSVPEPEDQPADVLDGNEPKSEEL